MTGSLIGGLALGISLGALGALFPIGAQLRVSLLIVLTFAAAQLDSGQVRVVLPTPRRQVSDAWLVRYRSWVYGIGFGLQLGLGVVTIVETWAMYLVLMSEALSGSLIFGAVLGLTFAFTRSLPILLVGRVRSTNQLSGIYGHLKRTEALSRVSTTFGLAMLCAAGTSFMLARAAG